MRPYEFYTIIATIYTVGYLNATKGISETICIVSAITLIILAILSKLATNGETQ